MKTARLIDTPRQAARFVSLIGYNKLAPSVGINEQVEQWLHMHTFLVKNRGVRVFFFRLFFLLMN